MAISIITTRDQTILKLMADGLTRSEIGKRMALSGPSVRRSLYQLYDKLGATNGPNAVAIAYKENLI